MEDAKYIELAARYLSGDINAAERRELMEWVAQSDANQASFDELIHLWGLTGDVQSVVFQTDSKAAWQKVSARINGVAEQKPLPSENPEAKVRTLSIKRYLLRVAAVILPLLAVGAWWLLQPDPAPARLITSTESTKEVILPDGSQVTLNKNSSLSYLEDFKDRKVTLVGEAFFEVARDTSRAFEIISDQTLTRVLGTSFNIRAYPDEDEVEVMVRSGKVAFREIEDQNDSVILTADEAAVFKKVEQSLEKTNSLGENANAWMKKEINANDIPLRELLKTVNYYFGTNVTVENPQVLECKVTIPGLEDPSLDYVLTLLEAFMDLEVDSKGDTIILVGEGCVGGN